MTDILFSVFNYLTLTGVSILFYLIIRKFLTPRSTSLPVILLTVLGLFLSLNITVFPEEVDGTAGLFFIFFVIIFLFYKDSLLLKFSVVVLFYPIAVSIAYVTEDTGFLIWKFIFNKNMSSVGQSALHSLTLFLRLPCWYLIYRLTKSWLSHISKVLTSRMWLMIDAISLTSLIGLVTVIGNVDIHSSYVAYPACFASVLASLGCCYLCSYIAKSIKASLEMQTLKYQQAYYEELEESQQNIRRLRHDMNNHLNIIGTLLRDNKTEEAKSYFTSLSGEFVSYPQIFCKNSTVNAVLSAKYQLALQHEIDCVFQVDLSESLPIQNISLCSLLANTLDNAIEASQKIADPNYRKLTLKARCLNGHLSYELTNAKVNLIKEKQGRYLSDKENASAHGIGLQNVKSIVAECNGTLDISYTDTSFTITILL